MKRQDQSGLSSTLSLAAGVYLIATPLLVFALYSPFLLGDTNLFHYFNEAVCFWLAMFLAPFAIVERTLAGFRAIKATTAKPTRRQPDN